MIASFQPQLSRFCCEIAFPNKATVAYHAFYLVYNREAVKDCAKRREKTQRTFSLRVRQRTRWTMDLRELHSVELGGRSRRTGRAWGSSSTNPNSPSFLPSFPPRPGQQEGRRGAKAAETELTCALPFKGFIVYPLVSRDDCRAIVLKRHPSGREKTRGINNTVKSHLSGWGKGKGNNTFKSRPLEWGKGRRRIH